MIGQGSRRGVWAVTVLLGLGALSPRMASGQQWYEHYGGGVEALRKGNAREAIDRLQRAIAQRPRPGRLVPTYGTNFEPRYFPYLRLAEAHLLLEAPEEAVLALERSAGFGIEPVEERKALEARARRLLEAQRPVAEPTPAPVPPAEPRPTPSPTATPPPEPPPTPAPVPVEPPAEDPVTSPPSLPEPTPRAAASPVRARPTPSATPARPALHIVSDPPGARAFLDDTPVGRTDPETGRLTLRELAAGRHRLRLSLEGHDDFIRELELIATAVTVEASLPPHEVPAATPPAAEPTTSPSSFPRFGVVAPLLVGLLVALAILIRSRQSAGRGVNEETPTRSRAQEEPGTDEVFPRSFGEYSLLRRIGKGGMAVVYEAQRRDETFALKRPLTGFLDDDRFRERFLREAELGRTLHHPGIIRLFDRGEIGNTPYFTMELVRGESLAALLDREGRLTVAQAADLTIQVAEALDYAHSKGVIHRDLKPSNIMIGPSGAVKVMDYGIARAKNMDGLTTTGAFLGTPSYVAPETVEAVSQPASDIYSLGVILFEMLTGQLPFGGDTAFAVLRNHCTTAPPVPSSLNYSLSEEIDRLVLRLLSKDPSDRPTAEELINELRDHMAAGR